MTSIGESAFADCGHLASVTFAEGSNLETIGVNAFAYCTSLNSIDIPSGVTTIGDFAFQESGLTSITIPANVTSIGSSAFSGCTSLATVNVWTAKAPTLGNDAFTYCNVSLTINYPTGATGFDENNWASWTPQAASNAWVTGSCVAVLDGSAFTISGSGAMADYSYDAFYNPSTPWYSSASDITTISIGEGVTRIGNFAFYGCASLASVTIPSGVTSIGRNAFDGCVNLATLTFADDSQLENINKYAFSCGSLTSITIPSSVKSIEDYAFLGCYFLEKDFAIENGSSLDAESAVYWGATICDKIEDGLCIKGNSIVNARKNITTATIPESVTRIEDGAFYHCTNLATITIPASVTSIGDFAFQNCTNLATVTILATAPPSLEIYVFTMQSNYDFIPLPNLTAINVPGGSIDEYRTGWSDYADKIKGFVTGGQIESGDFAGYWSTYYNSGCAVTVDANTRIYYISAIDGTNATLTENTDDKIIKAGQGVILKSTAANVTMSYSADGSGHGYSDNQLAGVDATTTISESDYVSKVIYTLAKPDGNLGFYRYYDNVSEEKHPSEDATRNARTLGANKAFLVLDAVPSSGARGFTFTFEDNTTGIDDVRSKKEDVSGQYYNLNGQRIAHPTKGLYIVNGKKVAIK
ncbi:MAG: leucine-rich repeat domain-containing protein [Prevotella sp.]|nr:leucine-rich repeat domain-containing protein [Prevotella sp.]